MSPVVDKLISLSYFSIVFKIFL